MSTFYNLPALGEPVTLLTHFVVREDAQVLYGFASAAERAAFRQLIRISGVGPRTALSVLSGMSVADIAQAVTAQDACAPGQGAGHRQEDRRAPAAGTQGQDRRRHRHRAGAGAASDAQADILQALVALGYSDKEARPRSRRCPGTSA